MLSLYVPLSDANLSYLRGATARERYKLTVLARDSFAVFRTAVSSSIPRFRKLAECSGSRGSVIIIPSAGNIMYVTVSAEKSVWLRMIFLYA